MQSDLVIMLLAGFFGVVSIIQFFIHRSSKSMANKLYEEEKQQNANLVKAIEEKNTQMASLARELSDARIDFTKCSKDLEYEKSKVDQYLKEEINTKEHIHGLVEQIEEYKLTLSNLKIEFGQKESALTSSLMSRKEDAERFVKRQEELSMDSHELKKEIIKLKNDNSQLIEEKNSLIEEKTRFLSERDAQKQKHEELALAFEEQKKNLREEMHNTMQKLLEGKIEKFDEVSIKALDALLKPFRENIEGFKKKIEENQKESSDKLVALTKEIEMVSKAGSAISLEASNLTKALKGEKQAQGRWGEMVLESVLEHSGLIKGEHFAMQESYKDQEGNQKRTDVIVKLPQDKSIVIDSKVSLVDYDRYISAESEELRKVAALALAKAFKNQIDILSSKDYAQYDLGTLQYVFMFVPIESAYAVAVHHDQGLYEYALKRNIIIVYPSTLVVTLKTIYMYWQRDKADHAIEAIYKEAGDVYDKAFAFVETFERVGRHLETLNGSYQDATKHLYGGRGNLIKRAQDLKNLGAKTSKNLKNIKSKNIALGEEEIDIVIVESEEPIMIEDKEA